MERYQKKNMQTLQDRFILNMHISLNIQNFMIFLQATFQTVVRLMWRNQEMRIKRNGISIELWKKHTNS